jgi:hypothetical protein
MTEAVPFIVPIALSAFWIWMFADFVLKPERIPANQRILWLIGFIFFNVLTAGYYFFTVYRSK